MTNLINHCLSLPVDERFYLMRILERSVEIEPEKAIPTTARFAFLAETMKDIIGEDFLTRCQERTLVTARMQLAYQLRNEGFTEREIAKLMDRDRSTINALLNKFKDQLTFPRAFKREMEIWKEFKLRINNE